MCRLFGFRSVIPSQVHGSLLSAENSLLKQSEYHPDGWGVAYYLGDCPHIVKSVNTAVQDSLFTKVSGLVSSETVVAHLRKATEGELTILNTHPFQFGRWVFAHNGNINDFARHQASLRNQISPKLARFILGTTDSELVFFLILSELERRIDLLRPSVAIEDVFESIRAALATIISIAGPVCIENDAPPHETFLSFVLTNGSMMMAHNGGKSLRVSTYKKRCSQRDRCTYLSKVCEAPSDTGYVNHFIVSSEKLVGENVWRELDVGELVGVDSRMMVKRDLFPYAGVAISSETTSPNTYSHQASLYTSADSLRILPE